MKKFGASVVSLGMILTLTAPSAWPLGIAMKFVDITLENVQPGASFNLRVLKNLPLVVLNQDKTTGTNVVLDVVLPDARELKEGYEPIPDPSWVQVLPHRFELGPGASASADVIVNLPNDPKLVGHHYEAVMWAHTEAKNRGVQQGVRLEVGLRARLRMSIGVIGPETLQREKKLKKLALINTNFSIRPDNTFVQDVAVGQKIDLKKDKKTSIKIINEADEPVELKIKPVDPDPNNRPQAGYEDAPDPKWLRVVTEVNKVMGSSIKEVLLQLQIPDKPEYRGKKYMFLLQTSLANEDLPLAYYNMVYVTTLP